MIRRTLSVLLAYGVTAGSSAEAQTVVDFRAAATYPVAMQPSSLVLHDLDRNGHLDVAVPGFDESLVTILLGDGSGVLTNAGTATAVGNTLGVAAGRFDADDLPDLLLTQSESDFMWLLRNRGGGLFDAPQRIASGHDPWPVVAVDFDDDGNLDAVQGLAAEVGGRVNVLYGNGDGTFADPIGTRTGGGNRALAVADFNGDGLLDAVATNLNRASVSVVLGREDGTLAPHLESPVGNQPTELAAGDLDEDGIVDIAIGSMLGDAVIVSLGIGDGRFDPATLYTVGDEPVGIALADFNQDGHLDVVAGNRGDGTVTLLYGDGSGLFGSAQTYVTGGSPLAVAVGDLNADTIPDVVTVNGSVLEESTAAVLLGNGPTLEAVQPLDSPATPSALALADMDGDATVDLVAALPAIGELALYLGRDEGFLLTRVDLPAISPTALALTDLDDDDRVDIIVAGDRRSSLTVLMNRGMSFGVPVTVPIGGVPVAVVASDYDRDGAMDIAAALVSTNEVVLLRGNGAGGFSAPQRFGLSARPVAMTHADVDAEGGTDVVVTLESGSLAVLLGSADLGFEPVDDVQVATVRPVSLTALDINGDVYEDLAVVYAFGGIQLLHGDGSGAFQTAATFTGLRLPTSIAARDVTGDGHADILISERTSDSVAVFAARGDGGFTEAVRIGIGDGPTAVQGGDFDGDGGYDLAASCDQPSVAFNRRTHALRGDANGDGRVAAADLITIADALADRDCTPAERHDALGTDADGDGSVCRRDLRAGVRRVFGVATGG